MRLKLTFLVILLAAVVVTLPSCSGVEKTLADDGERRQLIQTMVTDDLLGNLIARLDSLDLYFGAIFSPLER